MKYIIKLLIAFDYFANAFAPASRPGMTISSHAYMARADGRRWGRIVANILDRIQTDHCLKAVINDHARALAAFDELDSYLHKN